MIFCMESMQETKHLKRVRYVDTIICKTCEARERIGKGSTLEDVVFCINTCSLVQIFRVAYFH